MFYLIRRVAKDFRGWERPIRVALVAALGLLIPLGLLILFGPPELRLYACIGAFGLVAVMQVAVMLAYRDMASPLVLAQRAYLDNDFETARASLEALRADGKADVRALTLLGNTYRQLGDLKTSREILSEALNNSPEHQFPLYGFGRTLLSGGEYAEAAEVLTRAVQAGAPPAVLLDLAEAEYRAGDLEAARAALDRLDPALVEGDAPRNLMRAFIDAQIGGPELASVDEIGLAYWQAAADRFSSTAYGQDLAQDVAKMRGVGHL